MPTTCLTCGRELPDASINPYFHIAKCPSCNRVFNLVAADGGPAQDRLGIGDRPVDVEYQPEGIF